MAQSLTIELYQFLEERLGKEEARKVVSVLEKGLEAVEQRAEELSLVKKIEIKEELTKELATKADLAKLEGDLRADIVRLEGKIQTVKIELEGKLSNLKIELEAKIDKLNQKFNFMIILLIIALTLMNPVAAEVIKSLLRFLKIL